MSRIALIGAAAALSCVGLLCAARPAAAELSIRVTQSVWRLADAEAAPIEVRIRVHNPGPAPAENVVLRLDDGGPLPKSRAATTLDGAALWPVGTLPAGDAFAVTLTVEAAEGELLPAPRAWAVQAGLPITVTGRPTRLYGPAFPVDYLGPTPDADPDDPPITLLASRLGHDPDRIFAWMRDDAARLPYRGSLYGSRGAAYREGGNSHDRANLLVALLRASGVPAGYRFATLDGDALDRVIADLWPEEGRLDRGGAPLTLQQLRAEADAALDKLTPAQRAALGPDRPRQRAAFAALDDASLTALLFEDRTVDEQTRAALADHAWVEAYIDGAWIALDPMTRDAVPGETLADGGAEPLAAAMPDERRHHVAIRVVPEQHQEVWQRGQLERVAPVFDTLRGAGDFVGRALLSSTEVEQDLQSGFFFYAAQTTYSTTVELDDLERPDRNEVFDGVDFVETYTNFVGPLTNNHMTALYVDIELLAPGQAPGEGQVFSRPLADRLPSSARSGLPFEAQGDEFSGIALDSTDATSLLVSPVPVPARVTRAAQTVLGGQVDGMQDVADRVAALPDDGDIDAADHGVVQGFHKQLSTTTALLYDSNLGERSAMAAAHLRQRTFSRAPRIVLAGVQNPRGGTQSLRIDLVRETIDSIGAPGQFRDDRRQMRMSHGMLATTLESAVLESLGTDPVSVNRIVSEAAAAGSEFLLLEGPSGLLRLDGLALPDEPALRIRRALLDGLSVLTPAAPVPIDGEPRLGWYELAPDGALIGRLDDGSGGAMLEYGFKLYSVMCTFINVCPHSRFSPMKLNGGMINFAARLFGIIVPAIQAVSACAGGADYICQKLSTSFPSALDQALSLSFQKLVEETDPGGPVKFSLGSCDAALPNINAIVKAVTGNGTAGPFVTLIEGWCAAVKAFKQTYEIIYGALADPLVTARPAGLMPRRPGGAVARARIIRPLAATLDRVSVRGTVEAGHARIAGQVIADWVAEGHTLPIRRLSSPAATVDGPEGIAEGIPIAWEGLDLPLVASGSARLQGAMTLDAYGDPAEGVVALAAVGDPLDRLGVDALSVADAQVGLDTRPTADLSAFAAGVLEAAAVQRAPADYGIEAGALDLAVASAGPVGSAAFDVVLTDGALTLHDVDGTLAIDGLESPVDGITFAGADGTVRLEAAGQRERVVVDLDGAHRLVVLAADPPSGSGPFDVRVAAQTSRADDYAITAHAPEGWSVRAVGDGFVVDPPVGVAEGEYAMRLTVEGPDGLTAAAALTLTVERPAVPTVRLSIVESARHSVDLGGYSLPAPIVEIRHDGPREGRYALQVFDDAVHFDAAAAIDAVVLRPGEVRRVGLSLSRHAGAPLPAPDYTANVTVRAVGEVQAQVAWPVPTGEVEASLLGLEPERIILAPGDSARAMVTVVSTGNRAVAPPLSVDAPSAIDARLAPLPAPIAPGQRVAVPLDLRALPSEPGAYLVRVSRPPSAAEAERGLPPAGAQMRVVVTPPGSEGLVGLLIDASDAEDAEALRIVSDLYATALVECDAETAELMARRLRALADLVDDRYRDAETAAALRARADAIAVDGCPPPEQGVLGDVRLDGLERGADLVAALVAPETVGFGDRVEQTCTVQNIGDAASPATTARASLRLGGGREVFLEQPIPALAPDERTTFECSWIAEAGLGMALVTLEVDVDEAIPEFDEGNNRSDVTVRVVPIEVAPEGNRPPVFAGAPLTAVAVGEDYAYAPEVSDPDDDAVFLALVSSAPGIRLEDGALVGAVRRPGRFPIAIVAQDAYGASATLEFELEVLPPGDYDAPPTFASAPPRRVVVDGEWRYAPRALDPEGQPVAIEAIDGPAGLAEADGVFRWTPAEAGRVWIVLRATDPTGHTAQQRFSVVVAEGPTGPDLYVAGIENAPGTATVRVANLGDTAAPGTDLEIYEDRDGVSGRAPADALFAVADVPPLEAGELVELVVDLDGAPRVVGNGVFVALDPGDAVAESDETNNLRYSGAVDPPTVGVLLGDRALPATLTLLAPEGAEYRVLDPVTTDATFAGSLAADEAIDLDLGELGHFAVEHEGPLQAYLVYEIFDPDFGGDMFHPARDGSRVGEDFRLWLPTVTPNNRPVVMAPDGARITLAAADGAPLDAVQITPGQPWLPELAPRTVYRLTADAPIVVQSSSVTGFSAAPPLDPGADAAGDVGTRFIVSTRGRAGDGGALAVIGYGDATYAVVDADGRPVVDGAVAAGEVDFHVGLGQNRALSIDATGPIAVLAGDIAAPGAGSIDLLGEDFTQLRGQGGTALWVPAMRQDVGDTAVLAGPAGAAILLDDAPVSLPPFGRLPLPDGATWRVLASNPVLVQAMGGGDRRFDLGATLRPLSAARLDARPVLGGDFETDTCAAAVTFDGWLGNAGAGPIAAGAWLELVEIDVEAGSERILDARAIGGLMPGALRRIELSGEGRAGPEARRWWVRSGGLDDSPVGVQGPSAACPDLPPAFFSAPPAAAAIGEALRYAVDARDPEGAAVTLSLLDGPPGAALDGQTLVWTPFAAGRFGFVLEARDPADNRGLQTFTVAVDGAAPCVDGDGDGVCVDRDCDDADPQIGPTRRERPGNGVDDDCDPGTPDAVPGGGLNIALRPNESVLPVGVRARLTSLVEHGAGDAVYAGLSVRVEVACPAGAEPVFSGEVALPPLQPGARAAAPVDWTPADAHGPCRATARLIGGDRPRAATADVRVITPVVGTLRAAPDAVATGEPIGLSWTVENRLDRPVTAPLLIRVDGHRAPELQQDVELAGDGEAAGELMVDTADLPPAMYRARLWAGPTALATTLFQVVAPAVVRAPAAADVALDAAAGSPIRMRPLGPLPGGAPRGGTVRAVWDPVELTLGLDAAFAAPAADDAVDLRLVGAAGVIVAGWQRSEGASAAVGELTADVDDGGVRLRWTVPAEGLGGLAADDEIPLRVVIRHGSAEAPSDVFLWATRAADAEAFDDYGTIRLVPAQPVPEPEPEPDPEPGMGRDGGVDAGLDAEVDPGMGRDGGFDDMAAPDAALRDIGPDSAPPDGALDAAAPDAMVDVMPDAIPHAMPDAAPDAMPDAMGDAMDEVDGGGIADAMADVGQQRDAQVTPDAEGDNPGGSAASEGCDCDAADAGSVDPLAWLGLLLLLGGRRRIDGRLLVLAGLAGVLLLMGCDDQAGAGSRVDGAVDAVMADGASDTAVDAGPDGPVDGSPAVDAAADAVVDMAGETVRDAMPDAMLDAILDAMPDAVPDAMLDAMAPDGAPDAAEGPDAAPLDPGADLDALPPDPDMAPEPDMEQPARDAALPEPDLAPPEPDAAWPVAQGAGFGEPCAVDDDCASGICQIGVDVSLCSRPCDRYACPDLWRCAEYPGGVAVCVPSRVCVDDDGDGYGIGRQCLGPDCVEGDPAVHPGADEVCDGADDDCDGRIDEGTLNPCGECGAVRAEACNGFDDDCDGRTDEGVLNACGACGALPVERCDGVDDDCDGATDEVADCELACEPGEERPCIEPGFEQFRDTGECVLGAAICAPDGWLPCEGYVGPVEETCNLLDDDCDGVADEGVGNPCGGCGPPPREVCDTVDNDCDGRIDEGIDNPCGGCQPCGEAVLFPAEQGLGDPALAVAPDGAITVGAGAVAYDAIWVPNSNEDTFSRFDTRTGAEEGRYWVGENPSRTAVDLDGNAWVANRGDGYVTHVFHDLADCVDRDGDGVIRTSRDLNADGRITGAEMVGSLDDPLADECVHCRVHLGRETEWLRGVGVDAENFAWFGGWDSRRVWKIDPETCEVLLELPTRDPVYGLVIDANGNLYTSSLTSDCITHIDTRAGEVVRDICDYTGTRYGIAVDGAGHIWYGTTGTSIVRFDPVEDSWTVFDSGGAVAYTAGLVADGQGGIYVTGYNNGRIGRFDIESETWTSVAVGEVPLGLPRQTTPRGVTLDTEGNVWGICRDSSGLIKFDPQLNVLQSVAIVGAIDPTRSTNPYSYSDNTGFQLFNFTAREGLWRYRFDAGALVRFVRLTYAAFTPEGTAVEVRYRAAAEPDGFAGVEWSPYTDLRDVDLGDDTPPEARYLEMQFRLRSGDPDNRPVLRDVQVYFVGADCREPGAECPDGQACDALTGGCRVVPVDCVEDGDCRGDSFCDDNGLCRVGCRLGADDCPVGSICDPEDRVCLRQQADCAEDADCPAGRFCDVGFCTEGCRADPESCPPRFACDEETRTCQPLAPECAADGDCPDGAWCDPDGACLPGCRVGDGSCDTVAENPAGVVRTWLVTAPIAAEGDIDTPLLADVGPDESRFVLARDLPVGPDGAPVELVESASDRVRLGALDQTAYAMTWIEVDDAMDLAFGVGSDGPLKLWVGPADGPMQLIYRHDQPRAWAADTDRALVHLEPGVNRVMAKIRPSQFGATGFSVQLLLFGEPFEDARVRIRADRCDAEWHVCAPRPADCGFFAPRAELCNGIDEDCDGIADEDSVDAGTTCDVGDEATGMAVCRDGRVMCRAQPAAPGSEDPPTVLAGVLTDVVLPEGRYGMAADVIGTEWVFVDPGAHIESLDGAAHLFDQRTGRLEIRDAVLDGVVPLLRTEARFDGAWIFGEPYRNARFTINGAGRLTMRRGGLVDVNLYVQGAADLSAVALQTTDTVGRNMVENYGRTVIRDSVLSGLNRVPRVTHGIFDTGAEFVLEGSRLESLRTAMRTRVASVVRGNTIRDADVAVQIERGARPTVEGNVIDLRDVAHSGTGIYYVDLNPGAGGQLLDNDILAGDEDVFMWFDPDLFADDNPAEIAGNRLGGAEPAGRFRIGGEASNMVGTIRPIGGAVDYAIWGNVRLSGGRVALADGLITRNAHPNANWGYEVRVGATLIAVDPVFDDVWVNVLANSSAEISGATWLRSGDTTLHSVLVEGTLDLTGGTLARGDFIEGNVRRGFGIWTRGNGVARMAEVAFSGFDRCLLATDDGQIELRDSTFDNCRNGLWVQHRAVADPVSGCSFTEGDPDLASQAIDLRIDPPGRAALDDITFDLDESDPPILIDPDGFQIESATTIGAVQHVAGREAPTVYLRGNSSGGELAIGSVSLWEQVRFLGGSVVRFAEGSLIDGRHQRLTVEQASDVLLPVGTVVRNTAFVVGGGASATARGARFEATDRTARAFVENYGAFVAEDSVFAGFEWRQNGVYTRSAAADTTARRCRFEGLGRGLDLYQSGGAVLEDSVFEGCTVALYANGAARLSSLRSTIRDVDPERSVVGLEQTGGVVEGVDIALADTTFDIAEDDRPFQFHLWALTPANAISVSGNVWTDDIRGQGYRIHGDVRVAESTLAYVGDDQEAWHLNNNLVARTTGTLTVPDGVVLRGWGAHRVVDVYQDATLAVGAATFDDVRLAVRERATGQVLGADFSALPRRVDLLYASTVNPLTIEGCSFAPGGADATELRGVRVAGAADVAPVVRGNSFRDLLHGLMLDPAVAPTLEGNVFENCGTDITRL